jgi:hypothetical protein
VSPLWKSLLGVSLFLVAAIWSGLTAQEDVPADVKPYIGKWRSVSPPHDRASFTLAWEDARLRVTHYISERDGAGRVDLTSTTKMEKALLGRGYTISGGHHSPGFQIRNMVPKGERLQGEVLFGGSRTLTTYVKDE